jgi:hypothetical protein
MVVIVAHCYNIFPGMNCEETVCINGERKWNVTEDFKVISGSRGGNMDNSCNVKFGFDVRNIKLKIIRKVGHKRNEVAFGGLLENGIMDFLKLVGCEPC